MTQTFFESEQSSHPAISVLKGMDAFESLVKSDDLHDSRAGYLFILRQKILDFPGGFFRSGCLSVSDSVWKLFIFANSKPRSDCISGSLFQEGMHLFYEFFTQRFFCPVDTVIDGSEMTACFQDVIYGNDFGDS